MVKDRAAAPLDAPPSMLRKRKTLVIVEDFLISKLVRVVLQRNGYPVVVAEPSDAAGLLRSEGRHGILLTNSPAIFLEFADGAAAIFNQFARSGFAGGVPPLPRGPKTICYGGTHSGRRRIDRRILTARLRRDRRGVFLRHFSLLLKSRGSGFRVTNGISHCVPFA
jgi:hypothetical protein